MNHELYKVRCICSISQIYFNAECHSLLLRIPSRTSVFLGIVLWGMLFQRVSEVFSRWEFLGYDFCQSVSRSVMSDSFSVGLEWNLTFSSGHCWIFQICWFDVLCRKPPKFHQKMLKLINKFAVEKSESLSSYSSVLGILQEHWNG